MDQIAAVRSSAAEHLVMNSTSARVSKASKLIQRFSKAKIKHANDLQTAMNEQKEELERSHIAELEDLKKKYNHELEIQNTQAEARYEHFAATVRNVLKNAARLKGISLASESEGVNNQINGLVAATGTQSDTSDIIHELYKNTLDRMKERIIKVAKELGIAADGNTEELTLFYLLGTMSHRIKKSEDNITDLKLVQDRLRKAIDCRSPDVLGDQPLHMSDNVELKLNFFLEQVKSVVQNKEVVASAEQLVADRLRFFQEAVQEQESGDHTEIEAFMREGCEAINDLIVRAHGEKTRRMPSRAEYSVWLAAQKSKIEGIIDKNYKQAVVATRSLRDTIAAVDKILHDLFDTNKVPKPAWEDTVNSSPAECTSFLRTLPALLALGMSNHENRCIRLENQVLDLRFQRDNIIPEMIQFIHNVYDDLGINVLFSFWKPPSTTDTPLAFKSWLQGRQIEIRSKVERTGEDARERSCGSALGNSKSRLEHQAAPVAG